MTGILFVAGILGLFAMIALSREGHRKRMLRMWVAHHPEATLHWPFVPAEHQEFPLAGLCEKAIGRPPIGFAAAVEIRHEGATRWLAEYRATPQGAKTDRWFTLSAEQAVGVWTCESKHGLITVGKLEAMAKPTSRGENHE